MSDHEEILERAPLAEGGKFRVRCKCGWSNVLPEHVFDVENAARYAYQQHLAAHEEAPKVVGIRGAPVEATFKQQLLDYIAQTYDELVAEGKCDIKGLVFSMVNEVGGCHTGYFTHTSIEKMNSLYICRAIVCINDDNANIWNKHTCGN